MEIRYGKQPCWVGFRTAKIQRIVEKLFCCTPWPKDWKSINKGVNYDGSKDKDGFWSIDWNNSSKMVNLTQEEHGFSIWYKQKQKKNQPNAQQYYQLKF